MQGVDLLPVRKNRTVHGGMGWHPDLPDIRDWTFIPTGMELLNLPAEVRNDQLPAMPAVYDQLQLGSCTANGIGGAFEFELRAQGLIDFMPSRLFIYFNERKMEGTVNSDAGAQVRDGIKSIAKVGVAHETTWAYDINKFTVEPPAAAYSEAKGARATKYARVTRDAKHIQATLAIGKNIVFGVTLWDSFEGVGSNGIVPMPDTNQNPIGGHCMLICGYATINGVLYARVRNSWNTSWGDQGYCWFPMSYLTSRLASDFWVVTTVV